MKLLSGVTTASLIALAGLVPVTQAQDTLDEKLSGIKLPAGFSIEVYADKIANPRQMALGANGTVFVGSRGAGNVYAVVDTDGDFKADEVHTLLSKKTPLSNDIPVNMPNGVAVKDGALYVSDSEYIFRFDDIESKLDNPGEPVVVASDIPKGATHFWKFIAFGPDGKLYVPLGAPCNTCEEVDDLMQIIRMDPDGSNREVVARGVRNTLGFDWDPETGDFWFTENGMDDKELMGDELPVDELNRVTTLGEHFGFPYVHGVDQIDPRFGEGKDPKDYVAPALDLNPHAAALGMRFYNGAMFPAEYKNAIFIAEHASYKGQVDHSLRIAVVTHDGKKGTSYEPFATGWLTEDGSWGKPADVLVLSDGSMLVSDDAAHAIYRISYKGE